MRFAGKVAVLLATTPLFGCGLDHPEGLVRVHAETRASAFDADFTAPGKPVPELGKCVSQRTSDDDLFPDSFASARMRFEARGRSFAMPALHGVTGLEYGQIDTSMSLHAGDEVSVESAGGEVPAFQLAAATPATATFSEPLVPRDLLLEFERGKPFEARWSPVPDDVRIFFFKPTEDLKFTNTLDCLFAGPAGHAVVAASDLDLVEGARAGTVSAFTVQIARTTAGDWPITLVVSHAVLDQDGFDFSFPYETR